MWNKIAPLIAFCFAICCNCIFAQQGAKPNILFIAVDDLKPMLNCFGETHMKTPNIDRLAKMGTVFMNNYCQQAVCAPTRASLLTGQRPDYTRVWDLKTQIRDVNPGILTLPQYLKQNGYVTTGIGKVFDSRSVDKGSDQVSWSISYDKVEAKDYAQGLGRPLNSHYRSPGAINIIENVANEAKAKGYQGKELDDFLTHNRGPAVESADVPDDAYTDGAVAKKAIATLAQLAQSKQPFFYAVGFIKPHLPFVSPRKYWDLYDREKIKISDIQHLSKGAPEFASQASGELVNNYLQSNGEPFKPGFTAQPEAIQKELIHGYYAAVSFMDAQVGKLLDELKAQGLDKNTIIVLWGDHGWHLGDHGVWCKHSNYEQATRAPLIIAAPQYQGNQQAKGLSEFVDVFPTLTELVGLKTPVDLAGKSLVPILKNPKAEVKAYTQSQYPRNGDKIMGYTIRTKRYRYVAWYEEKFRSNKISGATKPVAVELYDYEKDPLESENLALKPDYQKVLKTHEKLMFEFLSTQKHTR